jgi:NADPH2:quinone reductase
VAIVEEVHVRGVRVASFGGPEVLELAELPEPEPGDGEVLLHVTGCGVNFADTHQIENTYITNRDLPFVPGLEVVGTTGDGRRLAALLEEGGYAERAAVLEALAFPVPDEVSDAAALALLVQGLTAWHLLRTSAVLRQGESVVVHAAAGGVGSLAVQLAKRFGAGRVIATASNGEKRALAVELGADVAVDPAGDLTAGLIEANQGRKVDVVLEMVGGRIFDQSLAALAPFGRLVFYGMAGRLAPAPIAPPVLLGSSAGVLGFWLVHCLRRPEMIREPMRELLDMAASGRLRPVEGATYRLSEVRAAHEDLRARRTVGKVVLDPTA